MNGKGDRPRPVDLEKYAANYDAIFRKPTLKPEKVDSYFNPRRFYSLFAVNPINFDWVICNTSNVVKPAAQNPVKSLASLPRGAPVERKSNDN